MLKKLVLIAITLLPVALSTNVTFCLGFPISQGYEDESVLISVQQTPSGYALGTFYTNGMSGESPGHVPKEMVHIGSNGKMSVSYPMQGNNITDTPFLMSLLGEGLQLQQNRYGSYCIRNAKPSVLEINLPSDIGPGGIPFSFEFCIDPDASDPMWTKLSLLIQFAHYGDCIAVCI